MSFLPARAAAFSALLLAGCIPLRPDDPLGPLLKRLDAAADADDAFQEILRGADAWIERLKEAMTAGARRGFPLVAVLYAQGEGDAVPLELKARHRAAFRWPAAYAGENALVEIHVQAELEADLARAGRPAAALLARALAREAPDEAAALRALRALLRAAGPAAEPILAGLLDVDRDLGGPRVCDVASTALLVEAMQDLPLRLPDREARREAARRWAAETSTASPEARDGAAAKALAERARRGDPEAVRSVLERLVGESIDDPEAWREAHPEWAPARPLDVEARLSRLSGVSAFRANRDLERLTGLRIWMPETDRLSELQAWLRTAGPPDDLERRWRRALGGGLTRLTVAVLGWHPGRAQNGILWVQEAVFHPTESDSAELRVDDGRGPSFVLHVQARDHGTRLIAGEFAGAEAGRARIRESDGGDPLVIFLDLLRSVAVAWVDDVPSRPSPRPPEVVQADVRARLSAAARTASSAGARRLLRALAYLQDAADLPLFRERKAPEALLLAGDGSGLEGDPRLEPWELEMALRKASDPALRERLEALGRRPAEPVRSEGRP